ncbi:hypothetical protein SAMN02745121_06384 [Nannocystis exedens]|uniref:Uncharacterized protein n=1 Tax=Nannocystis exedens TaxID=54 RepID=A0A1I2EZT4_9BACT|nr:hypothetical protein [Nannocystis exedens]PCC69576.1 hypothetical protein NAEX_02599 [Nannocystis exedens]SFE98622.1 hypothetical protein SAMN02745121_06384 [Nannocystis exedens]
MRTMRGVAGWCWAILGLACEPSTSGDTTGSTGASTSSSTSTSGATSTSTSEDGPTASSSTRGGVTTGPDTTGEPTSTSTTSSTGDATTATEECIVDPSQNLCSAGCDLFRDCCKCGDTTALPKDLGTCVVPTGIVAAACHSEILSVRLDGASLAEGEVDCSEPNVMWVQYEQGGDYVVELCGDACAAYLGGSIGELVMEVFCEAA